MSELGSDFERPNGDITPLMLLRDTPNGMALAFLEALAERLMSPRGAFWYDTDAGLDIRSYIADDEDPAVAISEINRECMKDERCAKCRTDIFVSGSTWSVNTFPSTDDGQEYQLTFTVSASKIDLLTFGPTRT